MKNTVMGVVLTIICVLFLTAGMVISGRNVRQNELDRALNQAVEEAVEEILKEDDTKIESHSELAADVAEGILLVMESDGNIQIDVLKCDAEKGILSVRATAHYEHINGKPGTVSAERTVILEEIQKAL